MPKIIDDVKNKIIITAKKQLLDSGYKNLNQRSIAKECAIAVGTIYNYFSSKDMIIASIILEDWKITIDKIHEAINKAKTVLEGFYDIYNEIVTFSNIYRNIWKEFSIYGSSGFLFGKQHLVLRNQISDCVSLLLSNHNANCTCIPLLAENILTTAIQEDIDFDQFSEILKSLFSKD